jgi:hypothetical protein
LRKWLDRENINDLECPSAMAGIFVAFCEITGSSPPWPSSTATPSSLGHPKL